MVEAVGSWSIYVASNTVEVADCLRVGSGPWSLIDPPPPPGVDTNCSSKDPSFWLLWGLSYVAWHLLDHPLSREGLRGIPLVAEWDTETHSPVARDFHQGEDHRQQRK